MTKNRLTFRVSCRLTITAVFWLCSQAAFADKVVMKNGDELSGDIKKIVNGDLHLDAAYGENIFIINWEEIERVEAADRFLIETYRGERVIGSFETDPQATDQIIVRDATIEERVPAAEVVSASPVEENFWEGIGVNLEVGYNYTKANKAQQLTAGLGLDYLAERWRADSFTDMIRSLQTGAPRIRRISIDNNFTYFLGDKWLVGGAADYLSSDELDLSLRSTYSGFGGRYLMRSSRSHLAVKGGMALNNESFLDPTVPTANSTEGLVSFEYNAFDLGDLTFLTRLNFFPSLSEQGRYRADFTQELRWEFYTDFYFSIRFLDNYDSAPRTDAPKNDFNLVTGIGWEY